MRFALILFLASLASAQVAAPKNPYGYVCNGFQLVGGAKVHAPQIYIGVPPAYPQEMSMSLSLKSGDRFAIFGCGFKGGEYLKFRNDNTGKLTLVTTIFISSTRIDAVIPDELANITVDFKPKQTMMLAKKK